MRDTGELERLTKKEGLLIEREIVRLSTRLSGIRSMKRRPDLLARALDANSGHARLSDEERKAALEALAERYRVEEER